VTVSLDHEVANAREVRVGNITARRVNGAHRISTDVDGTELWFESEDIQLQPAPEAFGCALLLPALHDQRALAFSDALDETWLHNASGALRLLHDWWNYHETMPSAPSGADPAPPRAPGTALCFTGGVDSFDALLDGPERPDVLVWIDGYDVSLDDHARRDAVVRSLRAVADATGTRAVVVRTNLRSLPLVKRPPWERAHGGALAAVGHLLGTVADRLQIASSIPFHWPRAWGSHWRLDPHWSSSRTRIQTVGAERSRPGKLRRIAHDPLVQQHLRVCWEHRSPEGNCSRCEKCVRTMVMLFGLGVLGEYPGFDQTDDIARRIDAIAVGVGRNDMMRSTLADCRLPADIETAIRRLMRRTTRARALARISFGRLGSKMIP